MGIDSPVWHKGLSMDAVPKPPRTEALLYHLQNNFRGITDIPPVSVFIFIFGTTILLIPQDCCQD